MRHSLFVGGHPRNRARAGEMLDPCPIEDNNSSTRSREWHAANVCWRILTYLEEFVNQDTCFVHHCDIERPPVLEE